PVGQSVQVPMLPRAKWRIRFVVRGRRWGAGWRGRKRRCRLMGNRSEIGARGFTLIELIVTLLVVAVAIGLVAPAIGRSTEGVRARAEVAGFSATLRRALRSEAGFTLLEVLVAFTILCVAVVAVIQGFAQGLRLLRAAGDQQMAVLIADQKAREVIIPVEGREAGNEGGFDWERTISV